MYNKKTTKKCCSRNETRKSRKDGNERVKETREREGEKERGAKRDGEGGKEGKRERGTNREKETDIERQTEGDRRRAVWIRVVMGHTVRTV